MLLETCIKNPLFTAQWVESPILCQKYPSVSLLCLFSLRRWSQTAVEIDCNCALRPNREKSRSCRSIILTREEGKGTTCVRFGPLKI